LKAKAGLIQIQETFVPFTRRDQLWKCAFCAEENRARVGPEPHVWVSGPEAKLFGNLFQNGDVVAQDWVAFAGERSDNCRFSSAPCADKCHRIPSYHRSAGVEGSEPAKPKHKSKNRT